MGEEDKNYYELFLNNNIIHNYTVSSHSFICKKLLDTSKNLLLLSCSMKSEEYSASWDSDIHFGDILFELYEIAISNLTLSTKSMTSPERPCASHDMGRNFVGRFEILILLSYEVPASLEEDGAWNVESERAQPSGREKPQSLRR